MPGITRAIFEASAKVFFLQGLGLGLGFLLQAMLSRTCGPVGLGGYTLFAAWLAILSVGTVPGLEGTVVFFLPRLGSDPAGRRKVVRVTILATSVLSILLAAGLLATGTSLFAKVGLPAEARLPFAFSLLFFSVGKLLDAILLGMNDSTATSFFNLVRTLLRILFFLPIYLHPAARWKILFGGVALECLLTLLLRVQRTRRRFPALAPPAGGVLERTSLTAGQIFALAAPMFGVGIIDTAYPFLDKAILGAMLSLEFLGIYRISESLAALSSIFVSPFMAFWPYISRLFQEDRLEELGASYRSINLAIIALMMPFLMVLLETSEFSLSLFGKGFARAGQPVLLILAFGYFVDALAGPAGSVLKMTKYSRLSFYINVFLLVAYLFLSFLLIPHYGLIGAALAKSFVMALGNCTNVLANRLLLKIFPYSIKHLWLLGFGGVILALRALFPFVGISTLHHFGLAFGEVALFTSLAAFTLRYEISNLLSGRFKGH